MDNNYISRLQLVIELGRIYNDTGVNPFVLKRDGSTFYDLDNSYVDFTCCSEGHSHSMTPREMLSLRKRFGIIPCPNCAVAIENDGRLSMLNKKDIIPGEDACEDIVVMKKYMLTDDPDTNAKRIAELAKEQSAKVTKDYVIKKEKRNGPQRSKQEGEDDFVSNNVNNIEEADEFAESMSYEEFMKIDNQSAELGGDTESVSKNNFDGIIKNEIPKVGLYRDKVEPIEKLPPFENIKPDPKETIQKIIDNNNIKTENNNILLSVESDSSSDELLEDEEFIWT